MPNRTEAAGVSSHGWRATGMWRNLLNLTGTILVLAAVAVPAMLGHWATLQMRNFRVVREGVLYRSGQMSISGLRHAVHDYGIKTVVSLREAHKLGLAAPDLREEEFCSREEVNFHRIVLGKWYAEDGS